MLMLLNFLSVNKCSSTAAITSSPVKLKPTKLKINTVAKSPYLESIHILPTGSHINNVRELAFEDNAKKRKSMQIKLLIISYFDLGPLRIGDVLSQHPDVFFFNEPLMPFDSSILKDGEEPISRRIISEATDYLEELFECKILESKMGYSDQIIKKMAKKAYSACTSSFNNVSECVQETCKSSHIIMAKTIRLYVEDAKGFLLRNKGVSKVIILQRDPRVTLNLRNKKMKPGWTAGSDLFFQGRSLCSRMLHDVQEAKRLEGSGVKDFYRIVLFEHFLKNPENVLKGLFSFIGVSYEIEDIKQLLKKTNMYKQIKRVLLNKWDWIPDDESGLYVDKACSFFYKNSLYNPMKRYRGFLQRYNLCKLCD